MKESNIFKRTVIGITAFWLIVFVFFPNILIFAVSFLTKGQGNIVEMKFTFDNYRELLNKDYIKVFADSFLMAFITTAVCAVTAFPFAYIISRVKSNIKNILLVLIIVPFWTSALIRTYAINTILASNGIINTLLIKLGIITEPLKMLYTNGAVIVGLVYTLLPFMIMPLYTAMEKMDYRYIEAAQDLGANKFNTFLRVIIPLTAPGIAAGSIMVFLPALGLFYIPDMLGGSKSVLIGNIIQSRFLSSFNWPLGAAVSSTLTLLMGLLILANLKTVRNMGKGGRV